MSTVSSDAGCDIESLIAFSIPSSVFLIEAINCARSEPYSSGSLLLVARITEQNMRRRTKMGARLEPVPQKPMALNRVSEN